MILPIVAYGDPLLRKRAKDIDPQEIDVKKFSDDMFETMYSSSGIGLAAPQVGQGIRMFVVDGTAINADEKEEENLAAGPARGGARSRAGRARASISPGAS